MARDLGDNTEIRMITKLKLTSMESDVILFVFQIRRTDLGDELPSIGIGIDAGGGDIVGEDSLVGIMELPEAALLNQALSYSIQDVLSLYAEGQSEDLILKTLPNAGGPKHDA